MTGRGDLKQGMFTSVEITSLQIRIEVFDTEKCVKRKEREATRRDFKYENY